MSWSVTITTCPRPVSYLAATLDSIRAAGWGDVVVCDDIHGRRGSWGNFLYALDHSVNCREAAWHVVFQDDVRVARGLLPWLETQRHVLDLKLTGVVSLYTALPHAHGPPGWLAVAPDHLPRKAYGALAYCFRQSMARWLLREAPCPTDKSRTDIHVGQWCKEHGLLYWQHNPSFVEHVGAVSAVGDRGFDQFRVGAHPLEEVSLGYRA